MNVLVTGGVGFIGSNVARAHLDRGDAVWVYDNFSRAGAQQNLDWLRKAGRGRLEVATGDVADAAAMEAAVVQARPARLYHMAGQVAVTTSVQDPRTDFEGNALGTFNVLEAVRRAAPEAVVLYASTNKVYGAMSDLAVEEGPTRYRFRDLPHGVAEDRPLDFHSPYGCSKGCGDQYARDYARIYGLRTVVLRQSCIYGLRQFGVEDQGWMAHLALAARERRPITVFGSGKQVRDVLWIGDLLAAYEAAAERIDEVAGDVFNIGGGPAHSVSVWAEMRPRLEALCGRSLEAAFRPERPGDQRVYISDIRKAGRRLGWAPRVGLDEGIERLWQWLSERNG